MRTRVFVIETLRFLLIGFLLYACTKDNPPGDGLPKPVLLSPANQSTGQPTTTMLYWRNSSDEENPSFSINFGQSNPPDLYFENIHDTIATIYDLNRNSTYYWSVKVNTNGDTAESNVFSFTTLENPKILPLKIGNQWFYKYSAYDSNGSVTDSSRSSILLA